MAARSRANRPPYEVMAGRPAQAGAPDAQEASRDEAAPLSVSPAAANDDGQPGAPMLSGGGPGQPLLFRVPRGVAVMAVVVGLVVIILAYWVGRTQGRHAALNEFGLSRTEPIAPEGGARPAPSGFAPPAEAPAGSARAAIPGPQPISASDLPREDTRQSGLNYLVLALYDRVGAERLVDFLGANGVDATIVRSNNDRFSVIDLRGFTAKELEGSAYREHRNKLRRLGQIWKREHNGATDLSDMWPKKH